MIRSWLQRARAFLDRFFFTPSYGQPLDALRIVIGFAMLYEALSVFPFLDDLYGQHAILQHDLIETLTGPAIPGMMARMGIGAEFYGSIFRGFYLVHIGFALAFLTGWRSRAATVGLWLTQTVILNSGYLSSYGVDRYFHNMLFLLIWLPVGRFWSLDARRAEAPQPLPMATFGLRLVQVYLLLTYFDAGHGKGMGTDWWTGEAIWRVLNQPEFHRFDFLWLANHEWICKALARGTIFLEGAYFLAAFVPRLGKLWVLGIIGMHLGIAFVMNLQLFGVTLAFVNGVIFLIPRDGFRLRRPARAGVNLRELAPC